MIYPLVESLAVVDEKVKNLSWHEHRFCTSYSELYGHAPNFPLLDRNHIQLPARGIYKLRVEYNEFETKIDLSPYDVKTINNLKIIVADEIDYHLKYTNRDELNMLFNQRNNADDILIIKNGKITDTFAGNIIFYDGKNWLTPDIPLLKGTCRARLIKESIIKEKSISLVDLKNFESFQVINALRNFDINRASSINNILA